MKREECVLFVTELMGVPKTPFNYIRLGNALGKRALDYDEYYSILYLLSNLKILSDELSLPFDTEEVFRALEATYGKLTDHKEYEVLDNSINFKGFEKWLSNIEVKDSRKYIFLLPYTDLGYNQNLLNKEDIKLIASYLDKLEGVKSEHLKNILKNMED